MKDSKLGFTIALVSMVATVSIAAGGCRIGNYSSNSGTGASDSDPVTGYYDAIPQSLQFCAAASTTLCVAASTTQIPPFISEKITNPLALILQNAETGEALMTAAVGGQTALPIWVVADNTELAFADSTSPKTLWLNPNCTTRLYLEEEGRIVRGTGHPVEGTNTGRTVGTLTLSVQVIHSFDSTDGSCAAELQTMSDCYQDINQCGGSSTAVNQDRQTYVQDLFETYIQAGAMAAADIPQVTGVGYEVHYQ